MAYRLISLTVLVVARANDSLFEDAGLTLLQTKAKWQREETVAESFFQIGEDQEHHNGTVIEAHYNISGAWRVNTSFKTNFEYLIQHRSDDNISIKGRRVGSLTWRENTGQFDGLLLKWATENGDSFDASFDQMLETFSGHGTTVEGKPLMTFEGTRDGGLFLLQRKATAWSVPVGEMQQKEEAASFFQESAQLREAAAQPEVGISEAALEAVESAPEAALEALAESAPGSAGGLNLFQREARVSKEIESSFDETASEQDEASKEEALSLLNINFEHANVSEADDQGLSLLQTGAMEVESVAKGVRLLGRLSRQASTQSDVLTSQGAPSADDTEANETAGQASGLSLLQTQAEWRMAAAMGAGLSPPEEQSAEEDEESQREESLTLLGFKGLSTKATGDASEASSAATQQDEGQDDASSSQASGLSLLQTQAMWRWALPSEATGADEAIVQVKSAAASLLQTGSSEDVEQKLAKPQLSRADYLDLLVSGSALYGL